MTVKVIKIGGNVIDSNEAMDSFLKDFATVDGPAILVHGGGKIATRIAGELGVETHMIEGRRITSKPMLDVAVMVYAGLVNKRIVARLQSLGVNAIGLCGADGHCITSRKRDATPVDYGEVGDVVGVDCTPLLSFIEAGMTPVICAITADGEGNLLNTNADTIAAEVATAISRHVGTELIFCFEKAGVLADVGDESTVIERITPGNVGRLIDDGIIVAGMLPKVKNALSTVTSSDVERVVIKSSSRLNDHSGTEITK